MLTQKEREITISNRQNVTKIIVKIQLGDQQQSSRFKKASTMGFDGSVWPWVKRMDTIGFVGSIKSEIQSSIGFGSSIGAKRIDPLTFILFLRLL